MTAIGRVGVFGGGRMGAGIAHAFAVAGAEVVVIENDDAAAGSSEKRVRESIEKAVNLGKTDRSLEALTASVTFSIEPAALSQCELVIEAVPEQLELKHRVLLIAERSAPRAALATNTSSISISELAGVLAEPERLIGLHFFNPVPSSDLVEIVVGRQTPSSLVERAEAWVLSLGKTSITVADSPGFASSRLGVGLALEAMRMLEEGVASASDIDLAMTLGYRHPMGPLRTTDLVGLDVRLAIAEQLHAAFGERFQPPAILHELVARGDLGRKAGRGFYEWN
ncbi:MAG: 3-hydroxyacyl-CoA dehydrogenase family protein [Microbacterium sp.]|jgi:3-hydroxybutyryl-CoA dehydrogenase|nr:3-hydroxyacyl-CoA dehydrogenase family protein [Microbacterium sp.]MBN9155531.1 3-hydroxyacyl-CoA dehydrogenase family protein [Microbacterium sp.]